MNVFEGIGRRPLRVMLHGNVCNNFYTIGKALNEHSDIQADLHLDEGELANPVSNPASEDPQVATNPPPWLKVGRYMNLERPQDSPLVRLAADYDLAIVSAYGPKFMAHASIPWCFYSSGADITIEPFWLRRMKDYRPHDWLPHVVAATIPEPMNDWLFGIGFERMREMRRFALATLRNTRNQADGIRRSTLVLSTDIAPKVDAIRRLRLPVERAYYAYNPLVMQSERFVGARAERPSWVGDDLTDAIRAGDFRVFMPSRLIFGSGHGDVVTGHGKRNDLFFEGFARFVHEGGGARSVLFLIDSVLCPDAERARAIFREQGVEDRIVWIRKAGREPLTRTEMLYFYSLADAVADDFGAGWFGSCLLEGLSAGCPVITYADSTLKYYPWHPVLSTRDPSVIAQHLAGLRADTDARGRRAQDGVKWIRQFHSMRAGAQHWAGLIRRVLSGEIFREPAGDRKLRPYLDEALQGDAHG
ncbi:MAG: hypothetical protein AB7Q97_13085 [Gammaproteobacteria bacterium]